MHRVLHLTRDFPPRHCGGMSTAVGGLARAQARAGLAVSVISFDAWRPRRRRSAATAQSASLPPPSSIAVLRIACDADLVAIGPFAAEARPSVIHVHDGMLDEFTDLCRTASQVPVVHTVHVLHRRQIVLRGSTAPTLSLVAQERALDRAERVIAPSRTAAAALLAAYPGLRGTLHVAGHGIDDSEDARAAAARHRQRPGGGPLLAVGRFADVKGTAELFEALRLIAAAMPRVEAIVAGGVPANTRAERRWIERWEQTSTAEVRRRVHFDGWLDPPTLATRYSDAAAVLIPSRYETFGLVALEAMLHGVPVVATDAGAIVELVEHQRTGLLSPVGDPAALAANAVAVLSDRRLAKRLSAAAARAVRERHLWEHALPRVLDAYGSGAARGTLLSTRLRR